jgi:hypothetical protein
MTLFADNLSAMVGRGAADGSGQGADSSAGRSWGFRTDLGGIASRLSRSATTALLLSPVGLLLVSVIRLLIIADFNSATASTIASSGGYVDTVLGTVIPLVPILIPYLALLLLLFNRVVLGILALLAVACATPMAITRRAALVIAHQDWQHALAFAKSPFGILALVVLGIPLAVLLLFELFGLGIGTFMRTVAALACIVLLPFVSRLYPFPLSNQFYTEMLRQPWLPAEAITLKSGQVLIGYTLSDDGNWIVILKDQNRTVTYYPAEDAVGRQVCQIGQAASLPPLIPLFTSAAKAAPPTPPCPEPSAAVLPSGHSASPAAAPAKPASPAAPGQGATAK